MSTTPTDVSSITERELCRLEAAAIVHGGLLATTPDALQRMVSDTARARLQLDLTHAELGRLLAAYCRGYAAANPVATPLELARQQQLDAWANLRAFVRGVTEASNLAWASIGRALGERTTRTTFTLAGPS